MISDILSFSMTLMVSRNTKMSILRHNVSCQSNGKQNHELNNKSVKRIRPRSFIVNSALLKPLNTSFSAFCFIRPFAFPCKSKYQLV